MTEVEQRASVTTWQRRLLPADLLEEPVGTRSARDWVVDLVLFGIALAVGLAGLAASWGDHNVLGALLDIVVGLAACVALWIRRRRPVAVAVFAVGASAVFATAGGAAPIAVFNVAVRSSQRAIVAIAVLSVAALATFPLVYASVGNYATQVLFSLLVTVVALGLGLFARVRHELVSSLRDRAQHVESEQRQRVEQAREAERRRIAREMHDVLAHRLSLLSVHAGALEFHPDAPVDEVAEAAGVIRATAQTALQELRDVIGVLREDVGDHAPQPTLAQAPALVEESRAAGMRITWHSDLTGAELIPDAVGRTAYRVVQEGLTNARKHAPDAAVEVTLAAGPPLVVEVVSRLAVGRARPGQLPGTGTGLIGLAERVALASGELRHGSDENGDFVLRASLPWTP